MKLPSLIFQAEENLVEKAWGGDWIPKLKGVEGTKIGESWEFSAHPSNPSEVLIYGKKVSMRELITKAKRQILGKLADKYRTFPLLVKILDIRDRISVQVHPSDEVANKLGEKDCGKDEGWIILESGKVYIGFREDSNPEDIGRNVLSKLNEFHASYLDTFIIPAGIIHSAEKVRILEISTNSNITYRIFDFRNRDLQLEKAKKALRFAKSEEWEVRGQKGRLEMDKFGAEVIEVSGSVVIDTMNVFNILFCIRGCAILKSRDEDAELKRGFSCLIPATSGKCTIESDKATIVRVYAK